MFQFLVCSGASGLTVLQGFAGFMVSLLFVPHCERYLMWLINCRKGEALSFVLFQSSLKRLMNGEEFYHFLLTKDGSSLTEAQQTPAV